MQPFVFVDSVGVDYGSITLSNEITVSSTVAVNLTVANGTLIVNGIVTNSSVATVNGGDKIQIRVIAALTPSTAIHATIVASTGDMFVYRVQTKSNPLVINFEYYNYKHYQLNDSALIPTTDYVAQYNSSSSTLNVYDTVVHDASIGINTIFFVEYTRKQLICFDTVANCVIATIQFDSNPISVVDNSTTILVATSNGAILSIAKSTKLVTEYVTSLNINNLRIANFVLYVTTTSGVYTFDGTTLTRVISSIDAIALQYVGGFLFVITNDGHCKKYNATTMLIVGSTFVGNNPWSISVGSSLLWIACLDSNTVIGCDYNLNIVKTFQVYYTPGNTVEISGALYVATYDSKAVIKIIITTGVSSTIYSSVNKPYALKAVGSKLYIADFENFFNRIVAPDSVMDALEIDTTIADYNSVVYSNTIVLDASINTPINVSIDNINESSIIINGINTNSTSIVASVGDSIRFSTKTSIYNGFDVNHVLGIFVGSLYKVWNVLCRAYDTTPTSFFFDPLTNILPNTVVESNTITILFVKANIDCSVSVGSIIKNGINVGSTCTATEGDTLSIRLVTPNTYLTSTFAKLQAGKYSAVFGVLTDVDPNVQFVKLEYSCSNILDYSFTNSTPNFVTTIDHGVVADIDISVSANATSFTDIFYAITANYHSNTLSVIDIDSKLVVKTVTGLDKPIYIGSSLDATLVNTKSYLIVCNTGNNRLVFLDRDTYDVTTNFYQLSSKPYGISTNYNKVLFVSLIYEDVLLKFSVGDYTLTLTNTIQLPAGSKPGFIFSDETKIYVALSCSNQIAVVQVSNNQLSYITVGQRPTDITADSTHLWVTNSFDNTVTQIKKSDNSIVTFNVCGYPTHLVDTADAIVVGSFQNNIVFEYDKVTHAIITSYDLVNSCYGLAVDERDCIFVASFYQETPTVVEAPNALLDVDLLVSTNTFLNVGEYDTSTTIIVPVGNRVHLFVPNCNDASIVIDGVVDGQSAELYSSSVIGIKVKNSATAPTYLPLLSDNKSALYSIAYSEVTTPLPFYFEHTFGTYVRFWYTSNIITIEGLSDGVIAELITSEGVIIHNGVQTDSNAVNVANGDTLQLKFYSRGLYSVSNSITVQCGYYYTNWVITNLYITGSIPVPKYVEPKEIINLFRTYYGDEVSLRTPIVYDQSLNATHDRIARFYDCNIGKLLPDYTYEFSNVGTLNPTYEYEFSNVGTLNPTYEYEFTNVGTLNPTYEYEFACNVGTLNPTYEYEFACNAELSNSTKFFDSLIFELCEHTNYSASSITISASPYTNKFIESVDAKNYIVAVNYKYQAQFGFTAHQKSFVDATRNEGNYCEATHYYASGAELVIHYKIEYKEVYYPVLVEHKCITVECNTCELNPTQAYEYEFACNTGDLNPTYEYEFACNTGDLNPTYEYEFACNIGKLNPSYVYDVVANDAITFEHTDALAQFSQCFVKSNIIYQYQTYQSTKFDYNYVTFESTYALNLTSYYSNLSFGDNVGELNLTSYYSNLSFGDNVGELNLTSYYSNLSFGDNVGELNLTSYYSNLSFGNNVGELNLTSYYSNLSFGNNVGELNLTGYLSQFTANVGVLKVSHIFESSNIYFVSTLKKYDVEREYFAHELHKFDDNQEYTLRDGTTTGNNYRIGKSHAFSVPIEEVGVLNLVGYYSTILNNITTGEICDSKFDADYPIAQFDCVVFDQSFVTSPKFTGVIYNNQYNACILTNCFDAIRFENYNVHVKIDQPVSYTAFDRVQNNFERPSTTWTYAQLAAVSLPVKWYYNFNAYGINVINWSHNQNPALSLPVKWYYNFNAYGINVINWYHNQNPALSLPVKWYYNFNASNTATTNFDNKSNPVIRSVNYGQKLKLSPVNCVTIRQKTTLKYYSFDTVRLIPHRYRTSVSEPVKYKVGLHSFAPEPKILVHKLCTVSSNYETIFTHLKSFEPIFAPEPKILVHKLCTVSSNYETIFTHLKSFEPIFAEYKAKLKVDYDSSSYVYVKTKSLLSILDNALIYNYDWFDCLQDCLISGAFESSSDAYDDAIAHKYTGADIIVSKSAQGCWLWSVIKCGSRYGGYIQGG